MSNLHRIHWIDAQIRAGCYPNARTIAERFEISHRQAARDIEYLRYSMGAPLEYYAVKNGYGYTDGAFKLPAYFVTHEEKQALSYLAQQYRSVGTEQAAQLSSLFARLSGERNAEVSSRENFDLNPLQTLPLPPTEQIIEQILRSAINQQQKVLMNYKNGTGEKSERSFAPYKVFSTRGNRYVVGYCDLRSELRVFRISRIAGVKIMDITFTPVPAYHPEDYQDDHPLRITRPYTAEVRWEEPIRGPLRFGGECLSDTTYRYTFHTSQEFLNYLLTFGTRFVIVTPRWLREKLRRRLDSLLMMNDD